MLYCYIIYNLYRRDPIAVNEQSFRSRLTTTSNSTFTMSEATIVTEEDGTDEFESETDFDPIALLERKNEKAMKKMMHQADRSSTDQDKHTAVHIFNQFVVRESAGTLVSLTRSRKF